MDINYCRQYEPIFGAWSVTRLVSADSLGAVFEIERSDSGVSRKAALRAITIPPGRHESGMDSAQDAEIKSSTRNYLVGVINDLVREISLLQQLKGTSNLVSYGEHLVIEHRDGVGWDILVRMERLTPLEDYLAQHAVTSREVIRLGIDLCRALEACWQSQIAYHDVKPENIFVSAQGDFKLGGLCSEKLVWMTAKAASPSEPAEYTAPEVYRGEEGGRAADVYSLGLVLYRLLNGNRLPFLSAQTAVTTEGRQEALTRRLSGAPLPPPAYAQGALAGVVGKACACDPRERYAGPAELRRALEDLLLYPEQEETPPAPPAPASGHKPSSAKSRPAAQARPKQGQREAVLPVLLSVWMGSALSELVKMIILLNNMDILFTSIFPGLLSGLLLFLSTRCSRRTVLLSMPAMLFGIVLGSASFGLYADTLAITFCPLLLAYAVCTLVFSPDAKWGKGGLARDCCAIGVFGVTHYITNHALIYLFYTIPPSVTESSLLSDALYLASLAGLFLLLTKLAGKTPGRRFYWIIVAVIAVLSAAAFVCLFPYWF